MSGGSSVCCARQLEGFSGTGVDGVEILQPRRHRLCGRRQPRSTAWQDRVEEVNRQVALSFTLIFYQLPDWRKEYVKTEWTVYSQDSSTAEAVVV